MIKNTFKLISENGLHARPATELVNIANEFTSDVSIETEGKKVDLKSIMCVMSLGIYQGSKMVIYCQGPDEDKAMKKITNALVMGHIAKEC